jgi:hypothetical protein
MTKIVKWYKRMNVWNYVLFIIAPLTTGGEIAVYFADGNHVWYWVIGIAGAVTTYIKMVFRDEDGDGIVDAFQKKKPNAKS